MTCRRTVVQWRGQFCCLMKLDHAIFGAVVVQWRLSLFWFVAQLVTGVSGELTLCIFKGQDLDP